MNKPYVYVTRKVTAEALRELEEVAEVGMWDKEEEAVDRETLLKESRAADGLVTMLTDELDEELFEGANHLKVVANTAVGYDNVDIAAAKKHHVTVTNTPDVLTETTADLAFALMMAAARRIVEAAEYVRRGDWSVWSPMQMAGSDVHHKTIGIVGMGRIGQAVARRAKGFGMRILYHTRSRKYEAEREIGAEYASFDQLLRASDFVIALTPLTDETKEMFNKSSFNKMKATAVFVNAGRGGTVDEQALVEALEQNKIAAAGLDVYQNEPIGKEHPLLKLKNVVALPHIGSASMETRLEMIKLAARNVAQVLRGEEPDTPVN